MKRKFKKWYVVYDRQKDEQRITDKPRTFRERRKRYAVFGPYNLAAARFLVHG